MTNTRFRSALALEFFLIISTLALSATPVVAQSDAAAEAEEAIETFWVAILESDFDGAAEVLHPGEAERVVRSLREGGQDELPR